MQETPALKGALQVVRALREHGFRALFAGGCVRDAVMGLQPRDYDIATDAGPDEVVRLFPKTCEVGAQFGVVRVRLDGHDYEVARFRRDAGYTDGRRPDQVIFSDEREDAFRRDFTLNGMFYDPVEGRLIDHVGGQEDVRRRILRAIGDPERRFSEDHLRLMRAVRFAARYHYAVEDATLAAVRRLSHEIVTVSRERIRDEVLKILTEGGAPLGIRMLIDLGLMQHLMPEACALAGVPQPKAFHPEGDVLTHTLIMLGMMRDPTPTLAMGVLLHDIGKPPTYEVADRIRFNNHPKVGEGMTRDICARLRLSSEETERIAVLVREHLQFMHVRDMRPSTLKRFLRQAHFSEHLELHRLDCLASHGDLSSWTFCRETLEQIGPEEIRPALLINGDDLVALGYRPGPPFRRVLTAVEDAQLEGRIGSREEALALAQEEFEKLGLGHDRDVKRIS
ncbi:MAG: CCA tRNA nucleotidyltransferase [Candidatus Latescibacteria bacterium]|nr:CCA tRNA nucleotidyltransferase [Candidatus Latescibacterota bacterium]